MKIKFYLEHRYSSPRDTGTLPYIDIVQLSCYTWNESFQHIDCHHYIPYLLHVLLKIEKQITNAIDNYLKKHTKNNKLHAFNNCAKKIGFYYFLSIITIRKKEERMKRAILLCLFQLVSLKIKKNIYQIRKTKIK